MDYNKEFTCGNITITRNDYECMPCPMNTSSLSDHEMYQLAEAINDEMDRWSDRYKEIRITEDDYDGELWVAMEHYGLMFGMTYYEDYD